MSLRARVTLLLSTAIILAVGFAGYAVRETAVQPLRADLMRGRVHEALSIGHSLRLGATLEEVREEHEHQVSILDNPPASAENIGPDQSWTQQRIRNRSVLIRRGKNPAVAIQLRRKWLLVETATPPNPAKFLAVLVTGGLVLLVGTVVIGSSLTRPLQDTQAALLRVSEGDLSQRLPLRGGVELEAIATSFNAMTQRISTMLRSEKQLMAGISHELRTPLARLRLQTELLRDDGVDPERLAQMDANLGEIDALVGEFLELSRLEAGASVLELEPIRLHDLAQTCVSAISPEAPIQISGESQALVGDVKRLKRVISTLLENAVKYGQGSPILVHIEANGLQISDRGPGVPEAELPRLFDAFFRGSQAKTLRGYGIGLSMAQQIIHLHGGQIIAANRPGGGLTIVFILPALSDSNIDPNEHRRLLFEA
jgi:signal transduction histidine kinase